MLKTISDKLYAKGKKQMNPIQPLCWFIWGFKPKMPDCMKSSKQAGK